MVWEKKADIRGPRGYSVKSALVTDKGRLELETDDGRVRDAGSVVGPQGLPGSNAIENDAAVAGYVGTTGTSQTQQALDKRYYGAITEGPLNIDAYARRHAELTMTQSVQACFDALDRSAASGVRGGQAVFERSLVEVDDTINVGQYSRVVGANTRATVIAPSAAFVPAAGKAVVRQSAPASGGAYFANWFERITIDARDRVDVGLFADRWNEMSGLQSVQIRNFLRHGLRVERATSGQIAQGYQLLDLEVSFSLSAANDAVGIYTSSSPRVLNKATVNTTDGKGKLTGSQRAIVLDGFTGRAENLHWENTPLGIQFGESYACGGFIASNLVGQATVSTNALIKGGLGTSGYELSAVNANGATVNLVDEIVNSIGGVGTITSQLIMKWMSGGGTNGQQLFITDRGVVRLLDTDIRGLARILRGATTTPAMQVQLVSETTPRMTVLGSGEIQLGNGSTTPDVRFWRSAANRASIDGDLVFDNGSRGPIVKSPNGTSYRLVISDTGIVSALRI